MKTIKWGILGTGLIARKFAEGLRDVAHAELLAIGSRSIDTAQSFARDFQVPRTYGSYEELASDPDIDVVYIATPHNLHCENTLLCLDKGRNVLCEKPFAVNLSEVKKMIARAREKNLFLMEALWSRFLPNIIKARDLIREGKIGEVKLLECDFGLNSPFNPNHRHYNRELIGGSLLDLGIYPVFLSLFLLGKPKTITSLAGIGPTLVDNTCSISFGYEKDLVSFLSSSIVAQTEVVAKIHGTKGKIVFDRWWFCPVGIQLVNENGNSENIPLEMKGNGYNYEAEEVVRCLQEGKTESEIMSHKDSLELIETLDTIRKQCGIHYPGHDAE
jgi:scyllo-inositol 2-dehydrogenase (NADP+)